MKGLQDKNKLNFGEFWGDGTSPDTDTSCYVPVRSTTQCANTAMWSLRVLYVELTTVKFKGNGMRAYLEEVSSV
jgi:hypothetical protein